MRRSLVLLGLIGPLLTACGGEGADAATTQAEAPPEVPFVPDAEILAAAGFTLSEGVWGKCGDPGTASYEGGAVLRQGDFNGDGRTDAIVTEGGTYCFGMTGTGYTLVSRQADGSWTIMDERQGIARLLDSKGADGWPDIEVGGPGFCFPVLRWNGTEYAVDRMEYEGQPCTG